MDLQLAHRHIMVTGGSSGIGLAIVRAFLAEGSNVAIIDRNPLAAPEVHQHENILYCQTDLTDAAACAAAVDETAKIFGGIDILVNNAGTNDGVGLRSDPENFLRSLQLNLVHYFTMAHYTLPQLEKSSAGAIVNIGSKVATTGQGGTSGYAAAKGGVNALTREWAAELAPRQIRVNTVIPAEVWTGMYENWLNTMENPAAEKEAIESTIPLGKRFTTPEEIASAVVFLASPRSSHTTGQITYVDGGYTHLDRRLK